MESYFTYEELLSVYHDIIKDMKSRVDKKLAKEMFKRIINALDIEPNKKYKAKELNNEGK